MCVCVCWGLTAHQPLWVILSSPREREKGEEIERDSREHREGQGRKRNRNEREETDKIKTPASTLTCYKDGRPSPTASQYQLDAPVTQDK